MSVNQLIVSIRYKDNQCQIDLCSTWIKIHKALQRIGIKDTIYDIYMNTSQIETNTEKVKGHQITEILNKISKNDRLADIHLVCKLIEYGDKEFIDLLFIQLDTYRDIKEILDDYLDFILYKMNHLTLKEKEIYERDYLNHSFEVLQLFGRVVLFSENRIPNHLLPMRIFRYEIRNDASKSMMSQLGKNICVHYGGTILSNHPIKLDQDGYRNIDEKNDVVYPLCPFVTLKQYMSEFKTKQRVFY